jgi:hypothetical protein
MKPCVRHFFLAMGVAAASLGAQAQLSSPMPGVPAGSGAIGLFAPCTPAPLTQRADVVPWSVLTEVLIKKEKGRFLPTFSTGIQALNKKTQRIQGFMMPLEPGQKQKHFLLSSVPLTCAFCYPGGPESMIEVKTKTPVKYSLEALVVEGEFAVLDDDSNGFYYRMTDVVVIN